MAGTTLRRGGADRARGRRQLTQFQMSIVFVLGIVGAFVGTIVALILLAIIIGLAGGH